MTNSIFMVLILTLIINFSFGSINFFGVHRSFMLLFRGTIENSISCIDESGLPCRPFYKKNLLEKNVEDFFASSLKRYTSGYIVSYFYLNDDSSYCIDDVCYSVKISLKATINLMFTYEKARSFHIVESGAIYEG